MGQKPNLTDGQAKLRDWAEQRRGGHQPTDTSSNVRPPGNGDRHEGDLARELERLEAMLGR